MRCLTLLTALLLAGCAAGLELPSDSKPTVSCVYNILKRTRGIEDPTVFLVAKKDAVIAFGYKGEDGRDQALEIFVGRRPLDERFTATANTYPADPQLANVLFRDLEAKCQVATGWADQVVITGPDKDPYRWRVDMSKAAK